MPGDSLLVELVESRVLEELELFLKGLVILKLGKLRLGKLKRRRKLESLTVSLAIC